MLFASLCFFIFALLFVGVDVMLFCLVTSIYIPPVVIGCPIKFVALSHALLGILTSLLLPAPMAVGFMIASGMLTTTDMCLWVFSMKATPNRILLSALLNALMFHYFTIISSGYFFVLGLLNALFVVMMLSAVLIVLFVGCVYAIMIYPIKICWYTLVWYNDISDRTTLIVRLLHYFVVLGTYYAVVFGVLICPLKIVINNVL